MEPMPQPVFQLSDVVTADALNEMLESTFASTGLRCSVMDENGTAISRRGPYSQLCRYAQDRPEVSDECTRCTRRAIQLAIETRDIISYQCHMGLACTLLPIEIDGRYAAFLLFSGYRMDPEQMKELPLLGEPGRAPSGADELKQEFLSVPCYSRERIQETIQVMSVAARYIAATGAHSLAQRQFHEKSIRLLLDENRRAGEQRLLTQAEYHAWRAQVSSHFLFNALDLIQSLAVLGRTEEIVDTAGALAALLRRNLGKNRALVSLKEEIRYLGYFTSLIQKINGERIRLELRAQPDCLWLEIPPYSISAFVEYILRVGIYPREEPSYLEVSLFRNGSGVDVLFLDNGLGLTEGEIHTIRRLQEADGPGNASSSYEMADTILRLRMHYGPRFYWSLSNRPNEQNMLRLHLPMPEEEP